MRANIMCKIEVLNFRYTEAMYFITLTGTTVGYSIKNDLNVNEKTFLIGL